MKRQLNISLNEELYIKLRSQAAAENVTMSGYIGSMLFKALPKGPAVMGELSSKQKAAEDSDTQMYERAKQLLESRSKPFTWPEIQEHLGMSDFKFPRIKSMLIKTIGISTTNDVVRYNRPPARAVHQSLDRTQPPPAAPKVRPQKPKALTDDEAKELQRTNPEAYYAHCDAVTDYYATLADGEE